MTARHPSAAGAARPGPVRAQRGPTGRGPGDGGEARPPGPLSATFPAEAPPGDTVIYGPDIADERELRLLGNVEGKRVLELGVGSGRNAVTLARHGARVIGVDPSPARIERARAMADTAEVRVELHEGELAEVPFVRADSIDLVLSVFSLATEPDADRVFRQAHRVLRSECPLVVSVPHPAWNLVDRTSPDPTRLARSWFDRTPLAWTTGRSRGAEFPRTFADLMSGLHRAGFRIEQVLEPEPDADARFRSPWWTEVMRQVPATLILRGRKLGL